MGGEFSLQKDTNAMQGSSTVGEGLGGTGGGGCRTTAQRPQSKSVPD